MIIWLSRSNEVIDVEKIDFCEGDNIEETEIRIECSAESNLYHFLGEEELDDLKKEWGLYSYEDVFNYIAKELYKNGRIKIPV
jgi:hypothetical protein